MKVNPNGYSPFKSKPSIKVSQQVVDDMNAEFVKHQSLGKAREVLVSAVGEHCDIPEQEVSDAVMRIVGYWSRIMSKQYDDKGRFYP